MLPGADKGKSQGLKEHKGQDEDSGSEEQIVRQ